MRRFVAVLLLLLAVGVTPAAGQSLSLSDIQEAYQNLDGLKASFSQVMSSVMADDSTRIDGTVLLSGNKYRVETANETVVTDGETTWIYTPADSQVVVNDADKSGSTLTPRTFLDASSEQYSVESTDETTRLGTPHTRLTMIATDSTSRFAKASLWARHSDRMVTRVRGTDRSANTLDLRLRDLVVNPETLRTGSPFTFSAPPSVDTVDLRQSK